MVKSAKKLIFAKTILPHDSNSMVKNGSNPTISRYLNLMTDFGFKFVFGREDVLIDFINETLRDEPGFEPVTSLEFLDKEAKRLREERGVVYDLMCTTDSGKRFIIEMQRDNQAYFINRSLYYVAKSIVAQGEKGRAWKFDFDAVYIIALLDFKYPVLGPKLRTDAMICTLDTHQPLTDRVRFIYIQMPNLGADDWRDCKSDFELIIYLIKNIENMQAIPFATPGTLFDKIGNYAEYAALSDDERIEYDFNLQGYRDQVNTIDYAREEGLARGRQEGIGIGRQEGIGIGRKEEQIAIARSLKALGVSDSVILKSTGLRPGSY